MLKAIGYTWPILAVVLILFTMWIVTHDQVPTVEDPEGRQIQAVGVPSRAELWIRALAMLTTFVGAMAVVRFGGRPVQNAVKAMKANAELKANGGAGL